MSINNVSAVRTDITEMLSKIREISNKSQVFAGSPNAAAAPKSFDDVMSVAKSAFTEVNHLQAQSEKVRDAYISGDSSVSMSQVVMASEKSKLAFEGLVTVRNKILEAYKEIMNMPV